MADTKHGKLGRFFFFTAWQILDCEVNFAFISSGFYKLNAFIFQTNECGLLRISLKIDSNFYRTDFLDTWLDARVHFDQWKYAEILTLSFNTWMWFILIKSVLSSKLSSEKEKKINFLLVLFQICVETVFFGLNVITNLWLNALSRARSHCLV